MGILAIVLGSQLPASEKLSLINTLSIMYSWFNLGGKMLKVAGLPHLWSVEKDILRKLEKLDAASAEAGDNADESSGAPNVVLDSTWHALRRWMHGLVSRKHARQGDAELKLVQAFVSQAQSDRATHASLLTRAAVIHDTPDDPSQPTSPRSVRAMRTFLPWLDRMHCRLQATYGPSDAFLSCSPIDAATDSPSSSERSQ